MPNDAVVAAPSAAASESVLSVPTNDVEYAEWRQTGKLPPKKEAAAASQDEPTNKDEAAASDKSSEAKKPKLAPDPESGNQEPHKKGKLSAKERGAQVDDEIADLEQKLARRAELRRQLNEPADEKKAETSTAKSDAKKEEAPKGLEAPVKPKWDDFKDKENGYELFDAAKDDYFDKLSDYKADKKLADYEARQQQNAEIKAFVEKVETAGKRYSDFDAKKLDEAAGKIVADNTISPVVKDMFRDSSVMVDVLYVMSRDAEKFDEFLVLARTNPTKALREFAVTENLVMEELGGKPAAKKPAGTEKQEPTRDATGKFQKTDVDEDEDEQPPNKAPEKKITAAPPPADEVGTRGSAPTDAVASAAKRNDFQAFRNAANRRDQASRRG